MSRHKHLFQRVGNTKIIPISMKILVVFICLLLLSNFSTNFVSVLLSQKQIIDLTNTILVNQLKQMFADSSNQYRIYQYSGDRDNTINSIRSAAGTNLSAPHSLACAVDLTGNLYFAEFGDGNTGWDAFPDKNTLNYMNDQLAAGISEGSIAFDSPAGEYFGVYKHQQDWNMYLIRAELRYDTKKTLYLNFGIISIIIIVLTFVFLWLGLIMLNRILKFIGDFTNDLYKMQQEQQLGLIDISKAPNDDITYFVASFNSLSSSVNNLLSTFQKFVSKDIVAKAYSEHGINLEGRKRELTMLFSDIRSFTYRTETLGNEIIDLLNVHYDRVIHLVHENNGVVGSIIGDAILGIFGAENTKLKSADAVSAAWEITLVTEELRTAIKTRRQEIEKTRKLSAAEERVYTACLIDIGVGVDGGNVFYGNIGSREHMANTVIGDNVNSSSRLEGLTRIYQLPVIVSEYIKNEVIRTTDRYHFYEIDTVQVKGKTDGKKIYFPLDTKIDSDLIDSGFAIYEEALDAYYKGSWSDARRKFKEYRKFMGEKKSAYADIADVFLDRIGLKDAPADWRGIWTMTTK